MGHESPGQENQKMMKRRLKTKRGRKRERGRGVVGGGGSKANGDAVLLFFFLLFFEEVVFGSLLTFWFKYYIWLNSCIFYDSFSISGKQVNT